MLGRLCNLKCTHCPVDAGPHCKIDLLPKTLEDVIRFLKSYPGIKTIELTGGEPGMHNGFMRIVQTAFEHDIQVIMRTNLIIFLEKYFEDIPEFLARHNVHILGSFPCVKDKVVESLMGKGVYKKSLHALVLLNENGYGKDPKLKLDLIHYPPLPEEANFPPPPSKTKVTQQYKDVLEGKYHIHFNDVYVMLHIPTGRMKKYLLDKELYEAYLVYLNDHIEYCSLPHLKKNAISIDYNGMISRCNPAVIDAVPILHEGQQLTLGTVLEEKLVTF